MCFCAAVDDMARSPAAECAPATSGAELDDGIEGTQSDVEEVSDLRAAQYLVSGGGSADGKLALWRCVA